MPSKAGKELWDGSELHSPQTRAGFAQQSLPQRRSGGLQDNSGVACWVLGYQQGKESLTSLFLPQFLPMEGNSRVCGGGTQPQKPEKVTLLSPRNLSGVSLWDSVLSKLSVVPSCANSHVSSSSAHPVLPQLLPPRPGQPRRGTAGRDICHLSPGFWGVWAPRCVQWDNGTGL